MIILLARKGPTAPIPVRWPRLSLAETVASDRASADCYCRSEDIGVVAVVVPELKFSDVQRQILLADLMVAANDPALEDAPEAFNRVGVEPTTYSPAVCLMTWCG
jgi:hypothetical protein